MTLGWIGRLFIWLGPGSGDLTTLEKAQALREVLISVLEQLRPPGETSGLVALQYYILNEAKV